MFNIPILFFLSNHIHTHNVVWYDCQEETYQHNFNCKHVYATIRHTNKTHTVQSTIKGP